VYFYKQAAEQGHSEAQFNIGRLSSVECDLDRAKHYFELAAGQGLGNHKMMSFDDMNAA
jgi:TPR repeat protein